VRETNRRLHERVSFSGPLSIRVGDEHSLADACDLSVWGMSFWTRAPLMIGDEVHIHLEDAIEHPSLTTRVRHIAISRGGYLVGVEHAQLRP
jgi:hypothetical protein